jgi:hypothetical protein
MLSMIARCTDRLHRKLSAAPDDGKKKAHKEQIVVQKPRVSRTATSTRRRAHLTTSGRIFARFGSTCRCLRVSARPRNGAEKGDIDRESNA